MIRYIISEPQGEAVASVMAQGHEQHVWNEGRLIGVSKSGKKTLATLPEGDYFYGPASGQWKALLRGWE